MKILLATEKPFAAEAVEGIKKIAAGAGHEIAVLEKYGSERQLLDAVADADALIVRSDRVSAGVVSAAPRLRIVVRAGAGYDNIDLDACTARGIVAMNTPGQNSNAVAELAIGMMIFMARGGFTPGTGTELKGKTLGIQAYGNIGRRVALLGKGLGMKVIVFSPMASSAVLEADGVEMAESIADLYRRSNYLSVNVPATAETLGCIGFDLIASMPPGAVLVNTARKEVIDEEGLAKALEQRSDLRYATDIAADSHDALARRFGDRVFATPKKMGAETAEANINAGLAAVRQIVDFFGTGNTEFQLNK